MAALVVLLCFDGESEGGGEREEFCGVLEGDGSRVECVADQIPCAVGQLEDAVFLYPCSLGQGYVVLGKTFEALISEVVGLSENWVCEEE